MRRYYIAVHISTCITAVVVFHLSEARLSSTLHRPYSRSSYHRDYIDHESSHFAYWQSSDAPITKLLKNNSMFRDALVKLQNHIQFIEERNIALLNTIPTISSGQSLQPCMYPDGWRFTSGVQQQYRNLRLGTPDLSCVSQLEGVHTDGNYKSPYSVDEIFEAVLTRARIIYELRHKMTAAVGLDWTDTDVLYRFPYNRTSQSCHIHPVSALRIGSKWYLDVRVTNFPVMKFLPRKTRRYLSEHIRVENGRLETLASLRTKTSFSSKDSFDNTTTFISNNPFEVTPSHYGLMHAQDNPALRSALGLSDTFIQQVEDAMTPSNVAILFLPLGLTLLPAAAITPVSTFGAAVYTIMSDVLAAVPLAIKGVELILIGSRCYRTVVVRLTGAINGSRSETSASELFVAECKAKDHVRPTGIKFLSIAICAMLFGITLELIACRIRKRRDQKRRAWNKIAAVLMAESYDIVPGPAKSPLHGPF